MRLGGIWSFALAMMVAAVLSSAASAVPPGHVIDRAEAPDWVAPLEVPYAQHTDENALALVDTQINVRPVDFSIHRRYAMRVTPDEVLHIRLRYRPAQEQLSLHRITIIAADGRQRSGFDAGEVTITPVGHGEYEAGVALSGLAEGTYVDWAATWTVSRTHGDFGFHHRLPEITGQITRTRLINASGEPLRYAGRAPDARGDDTLEWWGTPPTELATTTRWANLARWGAIAYREDWRPAPRLRAPISRLRFSPPEERVAWAVASIRKSVDYARPDAARDPYRPRPVEATLMSGWGDCKDQSLALVALLRELGLEASVAFTRLDGGAHLPEALPSLAQFDHAVVRVTTPNKVMWVDPTGDAPMVGYALPLKAGSDLEPFTLTSMAPTGS